MPLALEFTREELFKTLEGWKEKAKTDEETRSWVGTLAAHDLKANIFYAEYEILLDADIRGSKLKNVLQRAYAHNLFNLNRLYDAACSTILQIIGTNKEEIGSSLSHETVNFHDSLEEIANYAPMTPVLESISPLNESQRHYSKRADVGNALLIYLANRYFGKDSKRETYYIREDVKAFCAKMREVFLSEGIGLWPGKLEDLASKEDYLSNAVMPLVFNARQHAFKTGEDMHNGVGGESKKRIIVSANAEKLIDTEECTEIPADRGNYIVEVVDNGIGIPEHILPHIFEKGFSTKTDTSMQHGIGLWGVKQFVEKHGGVISVESKPGEGTTFTFTIPYQRYDGFFCAKED